jgi:hypothetical protein
MKKIALSTVFSFAILLGFAQNSGSTKSPSKQKTSTVYYSLFWGLIKSKNYKRDEIESKKIKIEPIRITTNTYDSLDNNFEMKQALWGAIQWTQKKRPTKTN